MKTPNNIRTNRRRFTPFSLTSAALLLLSGCIVPMPDPDNNDSNRNGNVNQNAANGNANQRPANANSVNGNANGTANTNANGAANANENRNANDNSAPGPRVTASAGVDRDVEDNDLVALVGAGTDSANAALTFSWEQIAGTPITTTGADTSTLAFMAPNFSDVLEFRLTVTSANGSASDNVVVNVFAAPILFVANRGGNSILTFRASRAWNGNAAPLTNLAGPNTRLSEPSSLVFDNVGGVIAAVANTSRIAGFLDRLNVTGDTVPERFVTGAAALLQQPEGLAFDAATDELYVANFDATPGRINVYANVSTAAFGGPVAPSRQIRSFGIRNPRDIEWFGDSLLVVNAGGQNLTLFDMPETIDGEVAASRFLTSTAFENELLLDAEIDADGRLWIVIPGRVLRFDDITTTDELTPDAEITIPGAVQLAGIVIDAMGRAYVTDSDRPAIYVIESVATRDGMVTPQRTIIGDQTTLALPWHLRLLER